MRRLLLLLMLATPALADQPPAIIQAGQNPAGFRAAIGAPSTASKGAYPSPTFLGIPLLWGRMMAGNFSIAATDVGGTGYIGFTAPYNMHDVWATFALFSDPNGGSGAGEVPLPNPITWSGTFEYPLGTFRPMTFNGALSVTGQFGWINTDPWGQDFSSQSTMFTRTYVQLSLPPSAASVTASTSSGSLAAGTYYAKVTQISGAQGESGPSPEATAVLSGTGQITIAWTPATSWAPPAAPITTGAASVPATAFNIYLSTTSGAEKYLATVYDANVNSYIYAGGITLGAASPPANQVYPYGPLATNRFTGSNNVEGGNYVSIGGTGANGSNQTYTVGKTWESSINTETFAPIGVYGTPDTGSDVPVVCVYGDSVQYGVNDVPGERGITARALLGLNIPYYFAPKPGESNNHIFLATGLGQARIQYAAACSDVISDYGSNDIFAETLNLAAVQGNLITNWIEFGKRGSPRVWQEAIVPRGTTTDSQATTINQYPGGDLSVTNATNASPIVVTYNQPVTAAQGAPVYINGVLGNTNANGQNFACNATGSTFQLYADAGCTTPVAGNGAYTSGGLGAKFWVWNEVVQLNTWFRCGSPIVSGAAVACGTSGALLAGQPGHPLTGFIDDTVNVEVNLAGALTQNGGRWLSNGTANYCTPDMTHPYPAVCGAGVTAAITAFINAQIAAGTGFVRP